MVVALLLASGAIGAYVAFREATRAELRLQNERAAASAAQISLFMERVAQVLGWTLAGEHTLRGQARLRELRLELVQLMQRMPQITELTWVDGAGREQVFVSRFDLDRIGSGRDFSTDSRFVLARRDGQAAGPVHFRMGTEPYLSLAQAATSRNGPVILAEINLTFVWDVVSRQRFGAAGIAYIVDGAGQLISHPDINLVLRHTDMAALEHVRATLDHSEPTSPLMFESVIGLGGTSVIAAAARVPQLHWTVFVETPKSEALAPVYQLLGRTTMLLLVGVAVSIAISLLLARRFTRPIVELERGAEALGAGQLDRRVRVAAGDELETLATQFNRMAERLQESYSTLEERIAQRTEDLARANAAKTRFLAAASHDLRQPMHALGLYVGRLRRVLLAPEAKHLAERIATSVSALEDLFEALLDISGLDTGAVKPNIAPVAVEHVFARLRNVFGPVAESRGLRLRVVPSSMWVVTDAVLLERILMNLVSNAVRFTERGGVVVGCRRAGSAVRILVVDSGIGIAPGQLPHIFQEFYQAEAGRPRGRHGLGLGLAIVERAARLLDHTVDVRSQPGFGTTFALTLKRAAPADGGFEGLPADNSATAGLRILVVDDDSEARESMGATVQEWGCLPLLACGSADALDIAADSRPDLVLCDLALEDNETGTDVVRALRAKCGSDLRAIYVTGETDPERLRQVEASGDMILRKPVMPARLRALVEALSGRLSPDYAPQSGQAVQPQGQPGSGSARRAPETYR